MNRQSDSSCSQSFDLVPQAWTEKSSDRISVFYQGCCFSETRYRKQVDILISKNQALHILYHNNNHIIQ